MLLKSPIIIILLLLDSIISNLNRKSFSYLKSHKTYIESHRGVNRELPENTLSAFNRAIQFDVDSIELDIWLTSDNIPVVIHGGNDGDISKTMNGSGSVKKYTFNQLSQFRSKIGNEKIPSLEEVFKLCKNKIFINIEIKDNRYDLVFDILIKLIEQYDIYEQIQISSFHHKYYDKVQEYNEKHQNKLEFGFLFHPNSKIILNDHMHTINVHHNYITKDLVKEASSRKIAIMSWFFIEESENIKEYKRLFKLGVDIICSNDPLLAKKYRDYYFNNFDYSNLIYPYYFI